MNITQKVRLLIEKNPEIKNMSTLEKRLNVSNGTIANWKTHTPSIKSLTAVADFFDCSLDYLTGRSENPAINSDSEVSNYDIDKLLSSYLDRYRLTGKQKETMQSVVLTYLNANKRF